MSTTSQEGEENVDEDESGNMETVQPFYEAETDPKSAKVYKRI